MDLSLRLNYSVAIHSPHSFNNALLRLFPSSLGGRDTSLYSAKLSPLSTVYDEGETSQKDFQRAFSCVSSSSLGTSDCDSIVREEFKVNKGKRSLSSMHEMIDDTQMPFGEKISTVSAKFQSSRAIHFRLLMENLGYLEETFADSEALKLKNDIMSQLGKLGALELFNTRMSRSLEPPTRILDFTNGHPDQVREHQKNRKVDDYMDKVFVQSSRKKLNKTKSKRAFTATEVLPQSMPLKADQEDLLRFQRSSAKRASDCKNRRVMVAKREVELSKAVKVLAELEKIRAAIENSTKQVVSLSSWAEASGVDEKVLQQNLHYCQHCQDELIQSTRSLVLYIARKYRGLGIALEDLLQAGYVGVLHGAERFDCTKGCRFSTYVQYWIRKSMSKLVARYGQGIVIPRSLSRTINQIQKAQKFLKSTSKKFPDDYDIAKMTGLSLDKIRSAGNCLKVVASFNQKIGDCDSVNYMEFTPDTSIESPEEAVMKQHMRKDLYDLLIGLDSRERQILNLRFGLSDHQPRSLEEIGRHFKVSKEWVRRLEKKALAKLRSEATISNLNYYLDLDL